MHRCSRMLNKQVPRLNLMSDGDISAAIWAAQKDGPFDLLLGIGAAPEGVISAAALRRLGGCFEGKLIFRSQEEEKRASTMIDDNLERFGGKKIYANQMMLSLSHLLGL